MRIFLVLSLFFMSCNVFSQIFYFNNTEITLTKTTDQSPVHWYIEVFSNLQEDSVLRWKSEFVNIPTEWNINLDCQSISFLTVNDNDSADFTLMAAPLFAQKLIIGATLNDLPGNGSVFFDIYDPNNPDIKERIAFNFIITQGATNSIEDPFLPSIISYNKGILTNVSSIDLMCQVYDAQGREVVVTKQFDEEINLSKLIGQVVYIILVDSKGEIYAINLKL